MKHTIVEEDGFKYIETEGEGEPILLLHGLFGALSNFSGILDHFGRDHRVVVPILPIYELPLRKTSLNGLLDYIKKFIEHKGLKDIHLVGNSLGGHIALLYALSKEGVVKSLILTGSSGLFESAMGNGFPKRGNYEFIRQKTADTFYDPNVATKELVDEVYNTVNDRNRGIRIVATAKSAVRHNLEKRLHGIKVPTLLIWGKQDKVTPPFVGKRFNELIKNSRLILLDRCGHAPMMERPRRFNQAMKEFINGLSGKRTIASIS